MDFIKITKVDNVQLEKRKTILTGTLHLTTHQLIFRHPKEELWISYPIIHTVERRPSSSNGRWPLYIRCRDFLFVTLSVPNEREAIDAFDSIQKLTCINSSEKLYAFFYKPQSPITNNGWNVYDPNKEFERMGVGSKTRAWRFSDINQDYHFCPTYPRVLVVPEKIKNSALQHAYKFRSKSRIPTLSYLHWSNLASITRSSQPMVGLKQNRSIQDEKLIEAIFRSNAPPPTPSGRPVYGSTATNLIVDARPTANVMANVAMGAGSEKMENYKNCKLQLMGIDNIHVMRESLGKLVDVIQAGAQGAPIKKSHLDKSGWLKHISTLLESSAIIIKNIHVNNSHVLVHCSDGWDRTAQLTSISELCLDPYYRTLEGFQVLVEKDWVSFGYKFCERSGHLSNEKYFITSSNNAANNALSSMQNKLYKPHVREISPVFHQFLDCVYQIYAQYTERFEFNEEFLIKLHFHVYSCQYGTFLCNSEKERNDYKVNELTYSVWDYFNSNREKFLNRLYDGGKKDEEEMGDKGVLFPESDWKKLKYWKGLFGIEDVELNDEDVTDDAGSKPKWHLPRSGSPSISGDPLEINEKDGSPFRGDDNSKSNTSHTSKNLPSDFDPWRDNADDNEEKQVGGQEKPLHHRESSNDLNAKEIMQNFARFTLNMGAAAYSNVANIIDAASTASSNYVTSNGDSDSGTQTPSEREENRAVDRELVSFSPLIPNSNDDTPASHRPWSTLTASIGFPTTSSLKHSKGNGRHSFPSDEITSSATTTPPITPQDEQQQQQPHPLFLYDS